MMKKLMVCLLVFCISTVCFAKGGSIELYGGLPLLYETTENAETTMSSYSVGFSVIGKINDFIALGFYGSFIFPQKIKAEVNGTSTTTARGDYDSLWGMDMLFGPVFTLYADKNIRIPFAVGFHGTGLWSKVYIVSTDVYELGTGINIGVEYSFTDMFYIFGRCQATWDFYSTTLSTVRVRIDSRIYEETRTESGTLTALGVVPCIGLGIRL